MTAGPPPVFPSDQTQDLILRRAHALATVSKDGGKFRTCGHPSRRVAQERDASQDEGGEAAAPRIREDQFSIVAPESFTRLAQIGDCSAMKRAKSSGLPGCVSALNFMRATLAPGVSRPSLMAALSLATIALGVRGGASTPDQAFCGNVGKPLSIMVGTSGSVSQRWALVTASGRSLRSSISG